MVIPSAAQDSTEQPTGLAVVCEANSADEATLATCLEIVETVLAPTGEAIRLVTSPTAEDFLAGMYAVMPEWSLIGARTLLPPVEASTKRTKKQQREKARQELDAARQYADQTREYLLGVTPDPCYADMYASAWGVATALQQWADKASKQPELVPSNTYNQLVESPQAITCVEPTAGD